MATILEILDGLDPGPFHLHTTISLKNRWKLGTFQIILTMFPLRNLAENGDNFL